VPKPRPSTGSPGRRPRRWSARRRANTPRSFGSITQEKTILEKKIDELRTFEHDHRTRLKTYLQSQLRELDGEAPAAPADPIRTPQDLVTSGSGARAETRP
jgi:hypothetical protein